MWFAYLWIHFTEILHTFEMAGVAKALFYRRINGKKRYTFLVKNYLIIYIFYPPSPQRNVKINFNILIIMIFLNATVRIPIKVNKNAYLKRKTRGSVNKLTSPLQIEIITQIFFLLENNVCTYYLIVTLILHKWPKPKVRTY